jgi:hypothetical protein
MWFSSTLSNVVLVLEPGGELAVPEKIVASAHLAGIFRIIHDLVAESVVEDVAFGLNVHPFLAIGWRNLVELATVESNVRVLIVVQDDVVDSGAEVL